MSHSPGILFLIDALERPGGTETHLSELAPRLEAHGFHPIVCNLGGDESVLRHIAATGVETWPRALLRLYMPSGRAVVRRVVQEAAGRNIHVVHTFHFKSDWMGVGVARALDCPLVCSRRDLGFQHNLVRRLVYRSIHRHVDRFIAPSSAVRDALVQRDHVSPERVEVIYNGLDLTRFGREIDRAEARAWLGVPAEATRAPLIGMVGGLRPVKDHQTLLRAMGRLVTKHPEAHLVLVGEGVEEERLRALASELGIFPRVTFAGPRQDIPRALAAMDIFVLSSQSEGMSNAVIEAMAAGLPVVATDVGGNAECVADGETGFIVPPRDEATIAERFADLLRDPDRRATMGVAGRARAAALFDVNAMVRHTAELYGALRSEWAERAEKGAAHAVA